MSKDDKIIAFVIIVVGVALAFASIQVIKSMHKDASDNLAVDCNASGTICDPPPECYTPENVREHYGETHCVDFTVGYTYETSAGTKFIDEKQDYQNGFVVYVPAGSNFSSVDLNQFDGKKVSATGLIKEYNGYPEIEATEYSQVSVY